VIRKEIPVRLGRGTHSDSFVTDICPISMDAIAVEVTVATFAAAVAIFVV
jgi:hypothetical protein